MRKYLVEFIGTFFLVLTVGMTVVMPDAGAIPPLAMGAALMVMMYAGAPISGGHYNPAVTVAVWLRGRCPKADVVPYIGAQLVASAVAALVVMGLKGDPTMSPETIAKIPSALIAELIGTFALCYVFLNVMTAKSTAGNSYFGLAIGFTVTAMAFALAGVSGGVLNPAVATGLIIMHKSAVANIWIYFAAQLGAGALAAVTFKFLNPEDK